MSGIETSMLIGYDTRREAPGAEVPEPPVVWYNGRQVYGHDQEVITDAMREVRRRESSMLNGLIK